MESFQQLSHTFTRPLLSTPAIAKKWQRVEKLKKPTKLFFTNLIHHCVTRDMFSRQQKSRKEDKQHFKWLKKTERAQVRRGMTFANEKKIERNKRGAKNSTLDIQRLKLNYISSRRATPSRRMARRHNGELLRRLKYSHTTVIMMIMMKIAWKCASAGSPLSFITTERR